MNRRLLWILACCAALIAGFQGCRSITPPVVYYFLSPIRDGLAVMADERFSRPITVGIRTVELPGYINRTKMVKRTGANQLEIDSFHRWAEYPDRMVQRVLSENLQFLMPDARVYHAPWPAGLNPDVVVDFTFSELIGTTDKKMLLSVMWTITGTGEPSAVQTHRTNFTESMPGSGFDDLAAAHSRVLAGLCRAVAEALYGFPGQ